MQDLEEEVRRLRCKGEEDEGCHEDGSRIDRPLKEEVSATPFPMMVLAAPAISRRYIIGLKSSGVVGRV